MSFLFGTVPTYLPKVLLFDERDQSQTSYPLHIFEAGTYIPLGPLMGGTPNEYKHIQMGSLRHHSAAK